MTSSARALSTLASMLAALAVCPGAGRAQVVLPPLPATRAPTEADIHAASAAYEAASAAYSRGDLDAALTAANTAWQALPNASTALTRAVVLGALGRHAEAFAAYLVASELGPTDAERAAIDAGLATHGRALDPPRGWVVVVTRPVAAAVEIDGTTFDAPRRVGVAAGRHRIHVSAEGYLRVDGGFEVRPGVGHRLEYELTKATPVVVEPPAPIIIKPEPPRTRVVEWILIGSGAAAVVVGAIFHADALAAAAETARYAKPGAEGLDDPTRRLLHQAALDDAESGSTAAISLYALGGALAITGALWLILDDGDGPPAGDTGGDARPTLSVGPGAAALRWRF